MVVKCWLVLTNVLSILIGMLIKIYSFGFGIFLIIIMVASLTEKGMREKNTNEEENTNDPRWCAMCMVKVIFIYL